jgi:hypothetical protein
VVRWKAAASSIYFIITAYGPNPGNYVFYDSLIEIVKYVRGNGLIYIKKHQGKITGFCSSM